MILGYIRVSTMEQARDGTTSLSEQEKRIKALASYRDQGGQFDLVVYSDEGVSGTIPLKDRPSGQRMVDDAKKGDLICAAKLDRLFRSASDALVTVEQLAARGVHVILLDMGVEPVTANGSAKLFFGMLSVFAEFERSRILERMTDGRRGKRERNGHLGGNGPPYGFRVVGAGRDAVLQPVEEELKVVKRIFGLRGMGIAGICRKLEQEKTFTRTGKPFQAVQVQRIIAYHKRLDS